MTAGKEGEIDVDALAALAANTISGTVHGPVLMGRDFGDITIGSPDHRPEA